ncbi:MAG: YbhB/YbcL family Raf kinase inhibitor-like protein [Spirochaetae bacterium HGW-Spirochaetae-1]|nr:MAG: YbhB/YbcL family Raf kinase inhibitor-like protein [Spirochaetae bacterium HGW-Spirochaetae-1]
MQEITLTSKAFSHGKAIPERYTGDGEDISPPLSWGNVPEGTKSYALICDDPDAPIGNWDHWVLFNIPGEARELLEHFLLKNSVLKGVRGGMNDFRRLEYGGPCPPGGTHRYFFKIYALDVVLEMKEGVKKKELQRVMEGHILGKGELMGTYTRRK